MNVIEQLNYVTEQQAAELTNSSIGTLRNWRVRGYGPPYTKASGRQVLYPLVGLRRWLESRTVTPTTVGTLADASPCRRRRKSIGTTNPVRCLNV